MQKIRKHRTSVYTGEHICFLAAFFSSSLRFYVHTVTYVKWLCQKLIGRVGLADPLHKFDTASTFEVNEIYTSTRRRVQNCDAHSTLVVGFFPFIVVFVVVVGFVDRSVWSRIFRLSPIFIILMNTILPYLQWANAETVFSTNKFLQTSILSCTNSNSEVELICNSEITL